MTDETKIYDRFLCENCLDNNRLDFDFTMAFQPIVDCRTLSVFEYEAMVWGLNNESAYSVIANVSNDNRYLFDQLCRAKEIALASQLQLDSVLSINFLPNAIYKSERCIRAMLDAAEKHGFPIEKIMFKFTEVEKIEDVAHVKRIIEYYNSLSFTTAIDDFGAEYCRLSLLANFQTNLIKLDIDLIRNINTDISRHIIIKNCLIMFHELNITVLAEGVKTMEEKTGLQDSGVDLFQGYLFAKPGFENLPSVDFSFI